MGNYLPKKGWIVLFTNSSISPALNRQFCPTGLILNNISFPKHNISIRNFSKVELLSLKKRIFAKNTVNRTWYTSKSFINSDYRFFNFVNLNTHQFQHF